MLLLARSLVVLCLALMVLPCAAAEESIGTVLVIQSGYTVESGGVLDADRLYPVECFPASPIDYRDGEDVRLGPTRCMCNVYDVPGGCPGPCSDELKDLLVAHREDPGCIGCGEDGLFIGSVTPAGSGQVNILFEIFPYDSTGVADLAIRISSSTPASWREGLWPTIPASLPVYFAATGMEVGTYVIEVTVQSAMCDPGEPEMQIGETENYNLLVAEDACGNPFVDMWPIHDSVPTQVPPNPSGSCM